MKNIKTIIYYLFTGFLGLLILNILDDLNPKFYPSDEIFILVPIALVVILFLIRNYPKQ